MSKRGEVEVQFNWILVLVAGAFIFAFFFGIIQWVKENSEQSSTTTTSTYLDSILTGSAVKEETVNKVTLPIEKIEFWCNRYKIEGISSSKNIRNKIIFSPSRIEGKDLVTWAVSWNVPFRVANLLMISSPQVRYIFFGDENDDLFKYLKESFPKELTPEFNPPTPLQNENNFKVRIIYVNKNPDPSHASIFNVMAGEDVTALKISAQSADQDNAEIQFYKKIPPVSQGSPSSFSSLGTSYFFARALLMGAIFSEVPEEYLCSVGKSIERLAKVASVYAQRSGSLSSYYDIDPHKNAVCNDAHNQANGLLISMQSLTPDSLKNFYSPFYKELQRNNDVLQKNSCALIY
jgi:hypothetical protein